MDDEVEKVDNDDDATIVFPDGVEHSGLYGRPNLHEQLVALIAAVAKRATGDKDSACCNHTALFDLAVDLGLSELIKGETRDEQERCLQRWLSMHSNESVGRWWIETYDGGNDLLRIKRGLGVWKYDREAGLLEELFEHGFEVHAVQIHQDFSEMRNHMPRYLDTTVIVSWWRWLLYSLPHFKNRINRIINRDHERFIYRVKIGYKREKPVVGEKQCSTI